MPYSTILEQRIDAAAKRWKNVEKKKMFGGVCYLLKGNMAFGIWKDFLIVRMDKDDSAKALKDRNVKPFDITGKPMTGWIMVGAAGWKAPLGLVKWTSLGKKFALSLPEKKSRVRAAKTVQAYQAYKA